MKVNQPQPYWGHVLVRFPKDMNLLESIAKYLDMRIKKNSKLSIAEWDACLDEITNVYGIVVNSQTRKRRLSTKSQITVPELSYLFLTATARKWNHVVFTTEQDRAYSNMSFYQDPYWQATKTNPETLAILRKELADE